MEDEACCSERSGKGIPSSEHCGAVLPLTGLPAPGCSSRWWRCEEWEWLEGSQGAREVVMGENVLKTRATPVLSTRPGKAPLLPISACSEPLFLLTMSETSCGMLCSGHDII